MSIGRCLLVVVGLSMLAIDPNLLQAGTNVLAAEIHQANRVSFDTSYDVRLSSSCRFLKDGFEEPARRMVGQDI